MTILPIAQANWRVGWDTTRRKLAELDKNVWVQFALKVITALWKWADPKAVHDSGEDIWEHIWTWRPAVVMNPRVMRHGVCIRGHIFWILQVVGKVP